LVQVNPVLAGRCLHEGRAKVDKKTSKVVVVSLLNTIEDPAVALRVRIAAGKVLGYIGDPRIGEMAEITAGKFGMGYDDDPDASPRHTLFLPDYKIGKYPVTNTEFSRFIAAKGYLQKKWWCKAGWNLRQREKWERPRFWKDDRLNAPNQPVVGISWFEAMAYCRWMASQTGTSVELPSEAQWEKAARGRKGRIYPWGNHFAADWANCREGEQRVMSTTPVGIYLKGKSPYGCLDMAGNVWEWTRSLWGKDLYKPDYKYPYDPNDGRENTEAEDEILRVLRGGSWDLNRNYARCSSRLRLYPVSRHDSYGFRVAVSPISSEL
jgi:formylglycine-generating enzyme required for sulfatase activity